MIHSVLINLDLLDWVLQDESSPLSSYEPCVEQMEYDMIETLKSLDKVISPIKEAQEALGSFPPFFL